MRWESRYLQLLCWLLIHTMWATKRELFMIANPPTKAVTLKKMLEMEYRARKVFTKAEIDNMRKRK